MIGWVLCLAAAAADEPVDVGTRWAFGQDVHVAADERARDVVVVGGDIEIDGEVSGNALAIGGYIRIEESGRVAGDTVVVGGRVSGAVEGHRVTVDPGVNGTLTPSSKPLDFARSLYQQVVWLLVVASAAVIVSGIFPNQVRRVARHVEAQPLRTAAIGLVVGGFVVLFSGMFTMLTLGFGLPISVVLVAALLAAWLLGIVALAHALGTRVDLGRTARTQWVAVLFGIVSIGVLTLVPVVGTVVLVVASSLSVGAVVTAWFAPAVDAAPVTRS